MGEEGKAGKGKGAEGEGYRERGGRARLGYLSTAPRVPSYATVIQPAQVSRPGGL